MRKVTMKKIRTFISLSELILAFSGLMDFILWFTKNFLIPCYTVTLFVIGLILLLEVLKMMIENEK
jgi:hypothetical protein